MYIALNSAYISKALRNSQIQST